MTFDDVTSGIHATSGHAQWYILYYYNKKKAREPVAHAHAITSGQSSSGHVISVRSFLVRAACGDVTSGSTTSSNATLAVLIYYWQVLMQSIVYQHTMYVISVSNFLTKTNLN